MVAKSAEMMDFTLAGLISTIDTVSPAKCLKATGLMTPQPTLASENKQAEIGPLTVADQDKPKRKLIMDLEEARNDLCQWYRSSILEQNR